MRPASEPSARVRRRVRDYLLLPSLVTEFERSYLQSMLRVASWFLVAHVPVMMAVAALTGTGVLRAGLLTAFVVAGPLLALRVLDQPRQITKIFAVAGMCLAGLLVHFGQGAMQIEMHFYFFVLLALLVVFADPSVILVAAATIVAHHLLLFFLLPRSIFNYEASLWTVVVHAAFVLVESVAACFVARSFFGSVIGLEKKVQRRTGQLEARGAELRLMLDTVDQGFLTLDQRGVVQAERSRALERWLPPCPPGTTIWDYVAGVDSKVGMRFELGWEAIVDDALPLELLLDQLPQHLDVGPVSLEIRYYPLVKSGTLTHVVLVLSDVTAQQERERAEEESADLLAVCERIANDRAGFLEFLAEADQLVRAIRDDATDAIERGQRLHTLKGNSGLFGLGAVARLCHAYEDALDEGPVAASVARVALLGRWDQFRAKLTLLFGSRDATSIEVTEADWADLRRSLSGSGALGTLERLRLEPVAPRLERLADQARLLASRLEKGPLDVTSDAQEVRLSRVGWAPLWSALTHVVQNAVDHGMQTPEERLAAGKSPRSSLSLSATDDGDAVRLIFADDGRGIDWDGLRSRAGARGLPADTHEHLVDALFASGISTRDAATTVSGRGVGLSAVRAVVRRMGGSVVVTSEPGRGTRIELRIPHDQEERHSVRTSWAPPRAPSVTPSSQSAS